MLAGDEIWARAGDGWHGDCNACVRARARARARSLYACALRAWACTYDRLHVHLHGASRMVETI